MDSRDPREALQVLDALAKKGSSIPRKSFHSVIKACILREDLAAGKQLFNLITKNGVLLDPILGSHLIHMFASCRSLADANLVFSRLSKPGAFAWTAIISAHSKFGQDRQAIKLFHLMRLSGEKADGHVFVASLKACGGSRSLQQGKLIHADIIEDGLITAIYVSNALIDMYCKCGSLVDGQSMFDKCLQQDAVSWNTLISGHAHHGQNEKALKLFQEMQQKGLEPNCTTWNALISGYARKGRSQEACELFQQMRQASVKPNNVTWNVIIAGFANDGLPKEAVQLLREMQEEGLEPDHVTLLCLLRACSNKKTLEEDIQDQAQQYVEDGYVHTWSNGSFLVDTARAIFDKLPKRALEAWNAMLGAYAQQGLGLEALCLFEQMWQHDVTPDIVTFVSIAKACSHISCSDWGNLIYATVLETMHELDAFIASSLIDMYAKCGSLENAHKMFDQLLERDVVMWTVILAGYTEHDHLENVLKLFQQMQNESIEPNRVTFLFLLKACSSAVALHFGKLTNIYIIESGCELDVYVGSSLIDMYAKCESFEDAKRVFDKLPIRLPVAWNVIIGGCVKVGRNQEAFQLFHSMQQQGIKTNQATYVSILKGCSAAVALDEGKLSHASFVESGLDSNEQVGTSLVIMYAKCGSLEDAYEVFVKLRKRDVVTWNAIIAGYAQVGDYESALKCFEDLQGGALKPDAVTFICLLAACSQLGHLSKGCSLFKSMTQDYGIAPTYEHFNCMIDVFGRAGFLNQAEDFLCSMPLLPSLLGHTSLLNSCREHMDTETGKRCFYQFSAVVDSMAAINLHRHAHAGAWESESCRGTWAIYRGIEKLMLRG